MTMIIDFVKNYQRMGETKSVLLKTPWALEAEFELDLLWKTPSLGLVFILQEDAIKSESEEKKSIVLSSCDICEPQQLPRMSRYP